MNHRDRIAKAFEYSDIGLNKDGALTVGGFTDVPDITHQDAPNGVVGTAEAWFLGPKGENEGILRELVTTIVDGIVGARRGAYADDPVAITDEMRGRDDFRQTVDTMRAAVDELMKFLTAYETPFSSPRYNGHMLSDTTLPGLAGYMAGMLQNGNTATMQASTAATPLAMLVGWDICNMIGYRGDMGILPWSHLTSNGTIANLESLWAHREARFLPFSARLALLRADRDGAPLAKARDLTVTTCDGQPVRLLGATAWDLANVTLDEALTLPQRMAQTAGLASRYDAWNAMLPFCLNSIGWPASIARVQECRGGDELGGPPVIMVPSSKHYSWPKAAAAMGIGGDRLIDVFVDADGRMDIGRLREKLDRCLLRRIPVQTVVAVIGSTQEGAVDPLSDLLAVREEYRLKGLDFAVHADAAWGGYMLTRVRRDFTFASAPDRADKDPETQLHKNVEPFVTDTETVPISDSVIESMTRLRDVDSITIDPHKWGYIQYPAGSISYRNGEIRRLTTFTGAYIGGAASVKPGEPTVGIFGLEGSRPGAAAASVFLSHRCIRPSVSGHGQLIERSMLNARDFTARLWSMNGRGLPFIAVPLSRLPSERGREAEGACPANEDEIEILRRRVIGQPIAAIRRDPEAMALLKAMGPDQNVVDFAFNLIDEDGRPQSSLDLFSRFNGRIYDAFHVGVAPMEPVGSHRFMMTKTIFQRATYGDVFIDTFARRLGLIGPDTTPPDAIFCLRCSIMNPFLGSSSPENDSGEPDSGESILESAFVEMESTIAEIAGIYRDRVGTG
ncbi:pyridoxal-dependent decarboxylase [Fodinicurvata sp. EGI_FJ10296]|uniref:pyridoxal phosphate-dependent decarboxylase family protein n=1 Tax=Fodinicurvata sp. EGI_FJ10296 TaxID=3231908 RepID=UPI003453BB21